MAATKAKSAARERSPDGQPSFMERFHAWWEGYELVQKPRPVTQTVLELEDPIDPIDPEVDWPTEYKDVLQTIWGEGFNGPGGADHVLSLVKSFGLSPASSIIEIGSGMGGGTRAIAHSYGAYVTGWELNPELAAEGSTQATVHSLEKQAEIYVLDPETAAFRSNFYQGALIREVLYLMEDKKAFLQRVMESLKQESEIIITDLVSAEPTQALDLWIAGEADPIHLRDIRAIADMLAELNVSVRTAEEDSAGYTAMIKHALNQLVTRLVEAKPPREKLAPTLTEVEKWARRVSALESGGLRYYRITGIKG